MDYAVIDLGSNTIRLSVLRYKNNKIITVFRQKEVAGLAGYIKKKRLEVEGIEKACSVLLNFKEIAIRFVKESEIHVFATAAFRGITNQDQSLEKIKTATGLRPIVLSGEEEARLDFIGASHFTECKNGILIDIGGASTELVQFENSKPVKLASLPIGCLSLYTEFVGKILPTKKERRIIKKEINEHFDSLGWGTGKNYPLIIGIGGTVRAAYKLSCELFSLPQDQNEIAANLVNWILNELKNKEDNIYHIVYKVIPERTLTIYTGLMILNEAIKNFGCKKILISGYGVREGYLIDRILKKDDVPNAGEHF